ncbi:MAG TPA: CBS domain-containing protein [Nitrososphaerales archaeon]|nr:CBS domain-containing protein [Nitrososphaerales archaeon]
MKRQTSSAKGRTKSDTKKKKEREATKNMVTRSATIGPAVRTRVLVREVTNSPVITADPGESILQVAGKMASSKVGSIVILKDDIPLGIVTEGDIVTKVVSRDLRPSSVKASDVMSSPLRTIEGEKEIIEAARAMRGHGIKRLGVTYKQRLVGIISISDILGITPELFDIISEKTLILTGGTSSEPRYLAGYCDACNQWSDNLLEIDSRFLCTECRTGMSADEEEKEQVQPSDSIA